MNILIKCYYILNSNIRKSKNNLEIQEIYEK